MTSRKTVRIEHGKDPHEQISQFSEPHNKPKKLRIELNEPSQDLRQKKVRFEYDLQMPPQIKRTKIPFEIYTPNHDFLEEKLTTIDTAMQIIVSLSLQDLCTEFCIPLPTILHKSPVLTSSLSILPLPISDSIPVALQDTSFFSLTL